MIGKLERMSLSLKKMAFNALVPELKAEIVDGKIRAWVDGPLARVYQPMMDFNCAKLNQAKVVGQIGGGFVYSMFTPPIPSPAGMRAIRSRLADMYFGIKIPTTATIAVTYACQMDCVHCSRVDKIDHRKKELSTDEMKRVIDDSLEIGIVNIVFTGGDPFVRKDIFELTAHVDKSKAQVVMFTHGLTLNQETVDRLKEAGLNGLFISIDDVDPEVHDKLRKWPGAYKAAFEGAMRLKRAGMLAGISTYATREKLQDGSLEALLQKAEDMGLNEVVVFDPMPAGKFRDKLDDILLTPQDRDEVRGLADKFIKRDNGMGVVAQSFINSPLGAGCFGGYYQFYLTPYGDVNPCDFNPISLGNVREKRLLKVWDDVTSDPEYKVRKLKCRMQDKVYRAEYLDHLPENAQFPVPIKVAGLRERLDMIATTQDGQSSIKRQKKGRADDMVVFEELVLHRNDSIKLRKCDTEDSCGSCTG